MTRLRHDLSGAQRALEAEKRKAAESAKEWSALQELSALQEGRLAAVEGEASTRLKQALAEERGRFEASQNAWDRERDEWLQREAELLRKLEEKQQEFAQAQQAAATAAAVAAASPAGARRGAGAQGGGLLAELGAASSTATAAAMGASAERLHKLLKQRESELEFAEQRVARLEATRDSLSNDLVATTRKAESALRAEAEASALKAEMRTLKAHHMAALEFMGERDEQVEELNADLADLRALVKQQATLLAEKGIAPPEP